MGYTEEKTLNNYWLIKYATIDGKGFPLSCGGKLSPCTDEQKHQGERIVYNRQFFWRMRCRAKCKQRPKSLQSKCNCTEEAAPSFQENDLTKKFVRFSRAYRNEQKSYKKCLFEEDVRRGLLSGKSFELIESCTMSPFPLLENKLSQSPSKKLYFCNSTTDILMVSWTVSSYYHRVPNFVLYFGLHSL